MTDEHNRLNRRQALKTLALAGFALTPIAGAVAGSIGAMMPGKGWMAQGAACDGDGTPLQFIPKGKADANPLENELEKYPHCPYCGMNRTKFNHSRHLVQYSDDLVDGTCSLHCLAVSLSLNLDRVPKAIYAADFGAEGEIKPLVNVDKASYLIGSKLKGTMSANSKMAFADAAKAKAAQAANGGETGGFNQALTAAYANMAQDTIMIRKRREEARQKMMKMKG
ncbi:MAG: nitrous oxide reductase accessory protein NosL [Gammaproteobacteria bacterium]|nr:nitrous oxide reductase accessory protein NosL [Gammaproteobacteria bacterium]MBU1653746.1 nitrous oxide reductase accessory protein NosL [Gammaproteobacteria bacterium]MBU1959623.1 nitrous oxide reductase accessory protein NosL [Gammaproteobacteria bacterium]